MNNLKKLLLTLACCCPFFISAQILNPGFEQLRPDGSVANWENRTIISIPLDSAAGDCHPDSVCFRTSEAHSGNNALEIRNILCYESVPQARVFVSDDIPAFGPSAPFTARPHAIYFYYKLYAVGGDGFSVSLQLQDVNGMPVATIDTVIYATGAVPAYQLASLPLLYENGNQPARIYMQVAMRDAGGGIANLHPGTRLLLDDFAAGVLSGVGPKAKRDHGFRCYPTKATGMLYLEWNQPPADKNISVTVTAADGRIVRQLEQTLAGSRAGIDVADLSSGTYFVKATHRSGYAVGRFVR